MSVNSHISLLDLNKQFPFKIDDALKTELCFAETLIISCGHYDGDVGDESSESEWSCHETTESNTPEEAEKVEDEAREIKDFVEHAEPEEIVEEDDDFHFFFFPDCAKPPPPKDSKASLIIVDGMPKINTSAKAAWLAFCTCGVDKQGKCICHTKLPCKCGAKVKAECTCAQLDTICICDEKKPKPVCTCKSSSVCVCYPGLPRPVCTCNEIDKPCVCFPDKFPYPVCPCGRKPCFCYPDKVPYAVCPCGRRPKYGHLKDIPIKIDEEFDFGGEEAESIGEESEEEIEADGRRMSEKSMGKMSENSMGEMSEKSMAEMPKNSMGHMSEKSVAKMSKKSIGKMSEKRMGKISEKSIAEMSKNSMGKISEKKVTEMPKKSMGKMLEKSMAEMSKKSMGKLSARSVLRNNINEEEPCVCQEPEPKPHCLCLKGKECTCNQDTCIGGVRKTCICEPIDSKESIICKNEDSKSICNCPELRCTCDAKLDDCKCFPSEVPVCTCGDPENCKCAIPCDCTTTCICDTRPKIEEECVCTDKTKQVEAGLICTCPCKDEGKKLQRKRAGKHGYRWCHEVDPRHTFFDYGYDRHDKISYKPQESEKIKILGIRGSKDEEDCPIHGIKVPPYKKKIRKPSLDCCGAVGGISISVETLGEDKDKFLVQVVSHSSKEGAKTGSKLVSILDISLHTMEENRIEHITKKDITKERRSYMAICESGYYNKVTRACGERHVVKRFYHSFENAHNFLLEGANVVLLRYFGLRRYKGTIKTDTVMIDGTICESIYACPGVSQAIVNGKPMFVVKVERHIIEPSGALHQTLTVLSLRGYIISHEWANSCYVLHLNPLLNIIPEKDEIEKHAPLRENWRQDLQLLSDFLDFKSTRSSEGARYVAENGALTSTVRDYLQAILLLRPQDALHFTRHYFGSALSALDLPHDEYFDPCPKHVRYFYFED